MVRRYFLPDDFLVLNQSKRLSIQTHVCYWRFSIFWWPSAICCVFLGFCRLHMNMIEYEHVLFMHIHSFHCLCLTVLIFSYPFLAYCTWQFLVLSYGDADHSVFTSPTDSCSTHFWSSSNSPVVTHQCKYAIVTISIVLIYQHILTITKPIG